MGLGSFEEDNTEEINNKTYPERTKTDATALALRNLRIFFSASVSKSREGVLSFSKNITSIPCTKILKSQGGGIFV